MSRRKTVAGIVTALAVAISAPAAAFGDSPWAGESGHFKGGSNPCKHSNNNPHCPPFGHND
jgi:hypothetical protein